MNYTFKGITAEELSFKLNRVKLPQEKLDIKPQFSREVRRVDANNKIRFIALSVEIKSTEESPKPFDIKVTLVGIFELENEVVSKEEERKFVIEATDILYPYIRSSVTNLTAQAYITPLNLPVLQERIFPEDRN